MSNIGMEETRKGGEGAAAEGAEAKGMDEDFEGLLMRASMIAAAWRTEIRVSNVDCRDR